MLTNSTLLRLMQSSTVNQFDCQSIVLGKIDFILKMHCSKEVLSNVLPK